MNIGWFMNHKSCVWKYNHYYHQNAIIQHLFNIFQADMPIILFTGEHDDLSADYLLPITTN